MRKQRGFVSGRRFRHIIFSKLIDALMHVLHKPNMTLPLAACRFALVWTVFCKAIFSCVSRRGLFSPHTRTLSSCRSVFRLWDFFIPSSLWRFLRVGFSAPADAFL